MPNCTLMMLSEPRKTSRNRLLWWTAEMVLWLLKLRNLELLWNRQREDARLLNRSWWMPVSVLDFCTLR